MLRNLDAWIRRRLRMYIWRQWKNGRTRYAQMRRLGVSHFHAAVAAGSERGYWRMARHVAVQQALSNAYFDSLGSLVWRPRRALNPIELPWYGPVRPVVWEGRSREAHPYPDQDGLYVEFGQKAGQNSLISAP